MEFRAETLTIALYDRHTGGPVYEDVAGIHAGDTGLGYYVDRNGAFTPTHLKSGYGLGPHFFHEDDIQAWIEAIAPLYDWQQSGRAIFADEHDYQEVVREMKKALVGKEYRVSPQHTLMQQKGRELATRT